MPDIRPISDLRNRFTDVNKCIKETGGPIFFTQNGRAAFVLLSNEKYEALTGETAPVQELDESQKKQFGAIIKKLRLANDRSEQEIADVMGISEAQVAAMEVGQYIPAESELKRFADTMDVKPETLQFFLEPMSESENKARDTLAAVIIRAHID